LQANSSQIPCPDIIQLDSQRQYHDYLHGGQLQMLWK